MSEVVEFVLARKVRKPDLGAEFPRTPADEILQAEILALREISFALVARDGERLDDLEKRIVPLGQGYGASLRSAIERDLRPATIGQIEELIFMLIEARQDMRDVSASFAEIAMSRVGTLHPSYGAMQAAVKNLIDSPRARFSAKLEISDILIAIQWEQELRENAILAIDDIPKLAARWRFDWNGR